MANLMIVDDSSIIRQRLRAILETLGHRVVFEATNGKEAVDQYKRMEKEIDLITLDLEMPGINGIEALRLIREQNPSAAVVMVSSVDDRSKVLQAIQLGAKHYFVKPFAEEKIREVIQKTLGRDESAKPNASRPEAAAALLRRPPDGGIPAEGALPLQADALETLPFELFHMEERTVLLLRSPIADSNVILLHQCLQGLLYFRKMRFVVELWEPIRHREGTGLLLAFVQAVRARQGKAAVVTDDPKEYAAWLSALRDDVYRKYKEIKW
jgi:two-component system chemotaxis response regulator CheY